jgi:hypothetical protein
MSDDLTPTKKESRPAVQMSLTKRQSIIIKCDDEASPFFNAVMNG